MRPDPLQETISVVTSYCFDLVTSPPSQFCTAISYPLAFAYQMKVNDLTPVFVLANGERGGRKVGRFTC